MNAGGDGCALCCLLALGRSAPHTTHTTRGFVGAGAATERRRRIEELGCCQRRGIRRHLAFAFEECLL